MSTKLTPRILYQLAERNNLLDSPIRICDGMAISFFPDVTTVGRSISKIVIDLSTEKPIEFDNLPTDDMGIETKFIDDDSVVDWLDCHSIDI